MINANASVKSIALAKKDYSWKPSTCICENSKHLKQVDDSVITCDEIIYVMDIISTNITNGISTNMTNTISTNFDSKKVRYKMDCYS